MNNCFISSKTKPGKGKEKIKRKKLGWYPAKHEKVTAFYHNPVEVCGEKMPSPGCNIFTTEDGGNDK